MRRCGDLLAMVIGAVCIYAAVAKLISPEETFESLAWAFGSRASGVIGVGLVAGELTLGVALIFGVLQTVCLSLAALLFLSFTLWIVYLYAVDAPVGCGCGVNWLTGANQAASSRADAVEIARASFLVAFPLRGELLPE